MRDRKKTYTKALFFGLTSFFLLWIGSPINAAEQSNNAIQQKGESIKIKGRVLDSGNKEPLIGVSVRTEGKSVIGTMTDFNGAFELTVPANSTISVTYVGYKRKSLVSLNIKNGQIIYLEEDLKSLDEVVVTGYQKIDRKMFYRS